MSLRLAASALLGLSLTTLAPFQCSHKADPNDRQEDTAGDALWGLAAQFRDQKDEQAARQTLHYLVARYPSNRHAPEARVELSKLGDVEGRDGGTRAD